jgi:methylenetetrahydrofolate reductase (NADPH)
VTMCTEPHASPAMLLRQVRFEVIPMRGVEEEAKFLPTGAIITVTASPRKTIEATLELSEYLASQGFQVVPHLSARQVRSREHLQEIVNRLAANAVHEVFVIGGDATEPLGPYHSASFLLTDMKKMNNHPRRIGIGAYPEGHHLINRENLLRALQEKQAYADYMVTQICFDAAAIGRWLSEIRTQGIHLPAYIGIPGVLKRRKLLEISLRVGVGNSTRFLKHNMGLVGQLLRRDVYTPDKLITRTIKMSHATGCEIAGFHIYTFNQCQTTENWRQKILKSYAQRTTSSRLGITVR